MPTLLRLTLLVAALLSLGLRGLAVEHAKNSPNNESLNYIDEELCRFISIDPSETVTGGNDTTICAISFQLQGSSTVDGTWSWVEASGQASFNPSNTVADPMVTVPSYGLYTFFWTFTDLSLCEAIGQVDVDFREQPIAQSTDSLFFCQLLNNALEAIPASGGNTGMWNIPTGNFNYNPILADSPLQNNGSFGNYEAIWTVSNSSFCQDSDTTHLIYSAPEAAEIQGFDIQVCGYSESVTALNTYGSWSSPDPELSFIDPNAPNTIANSSSSGAYTLVWTVGSGDCATTDTRTILFYDPPGVVITTTTNVACSDDNVSLNATSTNGTGLEWSTSGDGSFSSLATLNTIYSPGANDSINGTVTLTLTNMGEGTCPAATDEIIIEIIPAVEVITPTFGNPICSSATISINPTATNVGSVTWSTSGDGFFSPNNSVPLVAYTPGVNDGINGSVVLTLTGFPQSLVCPIESSSTTITLIQPPNAGADIDLELCVSGPDMDLNVALDPDADLGGTFSDLDASGALSGSMFDPSIAGLGSFDIGYTAAGTIPCSDDMSIMSIQVIAGPSAGSDDSFSLCAQSPSTDLNTYLSTDAESGGTWVPHPNLVGSIFDQGAAGIGNYAFSYVVSGNTPCEADTSLLQVEVTTGPDAGIDASIVECMTSTSIALFTYLGGDPDLGGTWIDISGSGGLNDGILDASLAGAGNYTFEYVVSLSGCDSDTSSVTVEVLQAPSVDIVSFPISICSIDTIFLEAGTDNSNSITWASSGAGVFGNSNALLNYYVPDQLDIDAGTIDISVIADGDPSCLDAMDTETILIITNPTSNAGLDGSTCGLDYIFPAVPSVGDGIWSGPPGIVYSSDPNAPFTVPSPGVYTFTWTEFNQGCVDSDEVTIEFLSSPVISSYSEDCINTNIEFVVVVQLEGGDPSSYEFSIGGTLVGNEFTTEPIPTGSPYSIAVWDANQCDTFLLEDNFTCPNLTDPGTFDTTPLSYCEGDEIAAPFNDDEFLDANDALVFILHDADPGIGTIISSSSTPMFSFQPGMSLNVTYYVSAIAGDDLGGGMVDLEDPNTVISEAVPVTFYSSPTLAVLTTDPGFCPGDSALIELSLSGAPTFSVSYSLGGINEQVLFESVDASFFVSEGGLLEILSIEDAFCSAALDTSLSVTLDDIPMVMMIDSAFSCSDDIQAIEVMLDGEGPWSYDILYESGPFITQVSESSPDLFIPTDSGTYTLVDLSDSNCLSLDSVSIEVIITSSPIAEAGPDVVVCADEPVNIGSPAQLNTIYSWSDPSTVVDPDQSMTYLIPPSLSNDVQILDYTVTAEFMGCFAEDIIQIIINPIPLEYGIDGAMDICEGDSTLLLAFGGSSYSWSDNGTIEEPLSASTLVYPTQDTTYMIEISNSFNCSVEDSISITIHAPLIPLVSAIVTDPCPPAQVLWVNETAGNIFECDWSFTEGTLISEDCSIAEIEYIDPGLQSGFLSVISIYGCQSTAATDTIEIFSGAADFSFSPSTLSIDDSLLHVFDISEDAATQLWLLDGDTAGFGAITTLSLEGLRPDFYEVCLIMTTNNSCIDTTCYEFELDNPVAVFVPNTFTPDGNGLNDAFRAVVHGWEYVKYFDLSVYDRRGHVMFNSQDPNEGWDGINRRDNTIALGLYEWVLEINVFGEAYPRRYLGTITVIK